MTEWEQTAIMGKNETHFMRRRGESKIMIRLHNDYNRGACVKILEKLAETNAESYDGYGEDTWCEKAADLIRKKCKAPEAAVHFFPGATQANFIVHAAALSPIQSVICPDSGHVYAHEAGSIENTGHKLVPLPSADGTITAEQIRKAAAAYYEAGEPNYLCEPKLVYISFPTEWGTLYSEQDLKDIRKVCDEYGMYLFVDGARLGYGLGSAKNDVTLEKLAELTDVFYIGGTKCGALFGEALVITNSGLARKFRTYMKQNGAVLAKGWLLGLQFCALLEDDTYEKMTARADAYAMEIKAAFKEKGIPEFVDSYTNQQFVIVTDEQAEKLAREYTFEQERTLDDGRRVVRFCTSWATTEAEKDQLIGSIRAL